MLLLVAVSINVIVISNLFVHTEITGEAYAGAIKNDEKLGLDIESLLENVKGLDDESIISACKATTYDVWYRNPLMSEEAKKAIDTNPNEETIENIRVMVKRSLTFFEKYGPIV